MVRGRIGLDLGYFCGRLGRLGGKRERQTRGRTKKEKKKKERKKKGYVVLSCSYTARQFSMEFTVEAKGRVSSLTEM